MDGGRRAVLFREVNDRIAEVLGRALPIAPGEFLCECRSETCWARVTLELDEYELLRRSGAAVLSHGCERAMSHACGERLGASGRLVASI